MAKPLLILFALCLPPLLALPAAAGKPAGMVKIPGGKTIVGCDVAKDGSCDDDNQPAHPVVLDAFWIDKTEVTRGAYGKCVNADKCTPVVKSKRFSFTPKLTDRSGESGADKLPISGVTWTQADTYCRWAGKRLPTEAEWERAARGKAGRRYPWGSARPSCDLAVTWEGKGFLDLDESKIGCSRKSTWPVCSKSAGNTPEGICDLFGNVTEWVADWYHPRYYQVSLVENPGGPVSGEKRVVRDPGLASKRGDNMWRFGWKPDHQGDAMGFRCARPVKKRSRIVTGLRKGADTSVLDAMGTKEDLYAYQLVLKPDPRAKKGKVRRRRKAKAERMEALRAKALEHFAFALEQRDFKRVDHPYGFVIQLEVTRHWNRRTDDAGLHLFATVWGPRGNRVCQESSKSERFLWSDDRSAKALLLVASTRLVEKVMPDIEKHLKPFLAELNAIPYGARLIKAPEGMVGTLRAHLRSVLSEKCRGIGTRSRKHAGDLVIEINVRCEISAKDFEDVVTAGIAKAAPGAKYSLARQPDGTLDYTFE